MLRRHLAIGEGRKGTKARGRWALSGSVECVDHLAGHVLDLSARVVVKG